VSGFLSSICEASRIRAREAAALKPLDAVVREARECDRPAAVKLSTEGFDLIAEVKTSSPSQGQLSAETDDDLVRRAVAYADAGAVAVSVLTEPERFGGNIDHLRAIASALRPLGVPAMRKDFLVETYQVWEAAAAGAGGVLLIIRVLDDHEIMAMLEAAASANMFVLLEAFDAADLHRARQFVDTHEHVLVGLNSRDLQTLDVSFDRLIGLAGEFPPGCPRVAESGIGGPADAAAVANAGYQLALVGTMLMQTPQPQAMIESLLCAGREATR
jgi:indole-3-glycerol phosphate synthase